MDVNRSGYYKWKARKAHPSERHIQRMRDVEYIREQSARHKAHGYRWLAAYLKAKHGVAYSPGYVYRCRKCADVVCESKHYRWNKPGNEALTFENLIGNRWNATRPMEILVSDMTAFYARGVYYELTLYFDTFDRGIVGFGLTDRRGDVSPYFEGLGQVLAKRKEQSDPTILHTDQVRSILPEPSTSSCQIIPSSIPCREPEHRRTTRSTSPSTAGSRTSSSSTSI
ncbi:MAG: hypothetical protein IJU64_01265 [Bacilli bacterium]|nr:hypothetical protein [Bacilli bacterium]